MWDNLGNAKVFNLPSSVDKFNQHVSIELISHIYDFLEFTFGTPET